MTTTGSYYDAHQQERVQYSAAYHSSSDTVSVDTPRETYLVNPRNDFKPVDGSEVPFGLRASLINSFRHL